MGDSHSFNCAGGKAFSQIGAAWLLSYLHDSIKGGSGEWKNVETFEQRKSKLKSSYNFVPYWIGYIGGQLINDNSKLENNSIGIDLETAKKYYWDIVDYLDNNKGQLDIKELK